LCSSGGGGGGSNSSARRPAAAPTRGREQRGSQFCLALQPQQPHSFCNNARASLVVEAKRWTTAPTTTVVVVMAILATSFIAHVATASATLYDSLVPPPSCTSSTVVVVAVGASTATRSSSESRRTWPEIQTSISQANDTLASLVQNWPRAVIDCTYADVPRDLWQQSNKAYALGKRLRRWHCLTSRFRSCRARPSWERCATIWVARALDPWHRSNQSCKAAVYKLVDIDNDLTVDQVELILQTVENAERAQLVRADSLSYAARRDSTALNNFVPTMSNAMATDPATNLWQCKLATEEAIRDLDTLLALLPN
jgi:hypothetical protein